jgi:hypothetical protein
MDALTLLLILLGLGAATTSGATDDPERGTKPIGP